MIVFDIIGIIVIAALIGLGLQTYLRTWEKKKQEQRWQVDLDPKPDALPPAPPRPRSTRKRGGRE